jgi:NAD(P)-dependent dehydrogenase (short-subunit alcohol dehydrogenase family)
MALNRSACALALTGAAYAAYRFAVARAREFGFSGRVVVITGGSRGLGLILARQLADEGARLAIAARDGEELRRAGNELSARAAQLFAQTCDVTDAEQLTAFLAEVRAELGPVDVLINNAGIMQVGPLETMTGDDFQEALKLHFWAPLRAISLVLPDMRRRGEGRIVNISSIGGAMAVPHMLPYCASKFALTGLSEGLRTELAKDGVYVTTVCPGLMRTGSPRHAWFKGRHREEYAWFSIGGSLPLLSMNAERAAEQIINACRYGRARVTLSLPAKAAVAIRALAPELLADVNALVGRLLPRPGGVGTKAVEGAESTSAWSPSWLTLLGERAAVANNELVGAGDEATRALRPT